MEPSSIKKDDYCQYCGALKGVKVDVWTSCYDNTEKFCSPKEYRHMFQNSESSNVLEVYCTNCGLMYHKSTIGTIAFANADND